MNDNSTPAFTRKARLRMRHLFLANASAVDPAVKPGSSMTTVS